MKKLNAKDVTIIILITIIIILTFRNIALSGKCTFLEGQISVESNSADFWESNWKDLLSEKAELNSNANELKKELDSTREDLIIALDEKSDAEERCDEIQADLDSMTGVAIALEQFVIDDYGEDVAARIEALAK